MPMDTYTYLLISLLLFLPWLTIYSLGKGLRKKMLKVSVIGGLAGFIAEYWYFKDYWHPPTLMGQSIISIEDFLFGFTIMGIAVSIYEFAFSIKKEPLYKNRRRLFGHMFLVGILCLTLFNVVLGINSIIVSCAVFVTFTIFILFLRHDLVLQAIASGVLTVVVVLPIYALLFNVINPDYWDSYWFLARTKLGVTVLGNIPVTELSWYFTLGSFAGAAHSFASGRGRVKVQLSISDVQVPILQLDIIYDDISITE